MTSPRQACRGLSAISSMLCCGVLLLSGCMRSEPPRFRLNMEGREPDEVTWEQQRTLVNSLDAMFGNPDSPDVFPETKFDLKKLRMAAGPVGRDARGQRHGLYREHCAHCHGISGDGAGPTALTLNPYPRDYRKGVFKFTSTGSGSKPTTVDLKRTIVQGIPGTAMPSFSLLPNDEIDALVEYVKYLAVRGETEVLVFDLVVNQEQEVNRGLLVEEALQPIVDQWQNSETAVLTPAARPATDTPQQLAVSIEAGRKLFLDQKRSQCTKCHGPTGLGDGGERIFDVWNDAKKDLSPDKIAEMWTLPLQEIRPRNLRLGIYRGGRRPVDLYRRIHAGIKGTPMPAAGPGPGNPGVLKPEEIWQLVDYVRSLPYEELDQSTEPHDEAEPHHEVAQRNVN